MAELWELFTVFFFIGTFTFGGGYAMLPIIQKEVVEKKEWVTDEEIIDYYAIGQCTPGVIAVNTATFIGYKRKGIIGGIIATMGVVTPPLITITIIATFFQHFEHYEIVQHAFGGMRIGVVALIVNIVLGMFKQTVKDRMGLVIFASAFIFMAFTTFSPIIVVIISALLGILKAKYGVKTEDGDVK
ncbi:MAG TPA: chromate transporter [Clostridia bacterium]|nr:chromate transporter [Clostridia bacterium]